MAAPKARVIDGKKFMWDGKDYDSAEEPFDHEDEWSKPNQGYVILVCGNEREIGGGRRVSPQQSNGQV